MFEATVTYGIHVKKFVATNRCDCQQKVNKWLTDIQLSEYSLKIVKVAKQVDHYQTVAFIDYAGGCCRIELRQHPENCELFVTIASGDCGPADDGSEKWHQENPKWWISATAAWDYIRKQVS